MKIANFPNPALRSQTEPAELVSPQFIVNMYNIMHAGKVTAIDDNVKAWFKAEAKEAGWNHSEFFGDQCLVTMTENPYKIPFSIGENTHLWEYIGELSQDVLECSYNEDDIRRLWAAGQTNEIVNAKLSQFPDRLLGCRRADGNYHGLLTALVKLHGGWAPQWGPDVDALSPQEQVIVNAFDDKYRIVIARPV